MPHPPDTPAADDDRRVHDHPSLGPLPAAATVRLTLDGRPLLARAGEPIVAALLAAGVRVFRTMPRSGEARGGWCMVGRCGDCAVVVDGRPNVPACVTPVAPGMIVRTQHGLGEDAWELGEGSAPEPTGPATDGVGGGVRRTELVVVGGGPAGLAAAIAAAHLGARTVLLDEQTEPGGRLRYRVAPVRWGTDDAPPDRVRAELVAEARAAGVDVRSGSVVWGLFDGPLVAVADAEASYRLAVEAVILATGSTDLAVAFPGASLPGVWTARAVQLLLNRHRVRPGRRFAVLGDRPEAAAVAADIRLAGGTVAVVADPERDDVAAAGDPAVEAVVVGGRRYPVEVVAVAVGRQPDLALAQMAGCPLTHAPALGGWAPALDDRLRTGVAGISVAGDAAGVAAVEAALAEGCFAGVAAAASLGLVGDAVLATERAIYEAAEPSRVLPRRRPRVDHVQTHE